MTEAEWLAATDPAPMLEYFRDKASDRKLIMLAVELIRRSQTDQPRQREQLIRLEVAQRFAEEQVSVAIVREVWGGRPSLPEQPFEWMESLLNGGIGGFLVYALPPLELSVGLIRDIFGNPFRLVVVEPAWLTSTVRGLAEGIYAERAFDRMPILADALEEAGCDHADILAHCRGDGPHVRGCWVVDLVLDKV